MGYIVQGIFHKLAYFSLIIVGLIKPLEKSINLLCQTSTIPVSYLLVFHSLKCSVETPLPSV